MKSKSLVRAAAALVGPSIAGFALAISCYPQNIYLFDRGVVPTGTLADAGTSSPPSEPLDAALDPEPVEAAARKQPACNSAACDACVAQGVCNIEGEQLFCHPEREGCSFPCNVDDSSAAEGGCPASQRCDRRLGLCVQCVADGDCDGDTPVCDVRRGSCVECTMPTHCTTARPICDPASSQCVECDSDLNCRSAGGVCLSSTQRCVQCRSDDDCSGSEASHCLPEEQRCVECIVDGDCNDPTRPLCSSERECEDVAGADDDSGGEDSD